MRQNGFSSPTLGGVFHLLATVRVKQTETSSETHLADSETERKGWGEGRGREGEDRGHVMS